MNRLTMIFSRIEWFFGCGHNAFKGIRRYQEKHDSRYADAYEQYYKDNPPQKEVEDVQYEEVEDDREDDN